MKVTINVDCKPAEAREFCGLPDLRPLQAAWLLEIEKRMLAEVERRLAASRGAKLVIWNRSSQHYGRALSRMRQQECGLALCLRNRMAILECAEWPSPAADLQARRCGETGGRLWNSAEVDHRVPLFRVWSE